MQITDEKNTNQPVTHPLPINEPVTHPDDTESLPLSPEEADEIFVNAVAEIPTQPLPKLRRREETHTLILLYLSVLSFVAGSLIAILTYPTVTVTLVPVQKSLQLTTTLALATRSLPPVTSSKSLSAPTTGKGHQDATNATGILTFYNGLFTQQQIASGAVFTGSDGIRIVTDEQITIPAANPPQFAEATVTAHALIPGATGNIQAGDITTTLVNGVLIKNSQFTGGQDARDYQAVAPNDLDDLTSKLQQQLTEELPRLFLLRSGEAFQTTNCMFKAAANHQPGDEASEVTVKASQTCRAIAYNQDELQQKATVAFTITQPGRNYELVGKVAMSIVRVFPFTVHTKGLWAYVLSQDYQQLLAEKIAGDSPKQAKQYLLQTGLIIQATIPQTLPQDPAHIEFVVLIGI